MTRFRPCIDLHEGRVKQIVGGTLTEHAGELRTNFVSPHSPEYFAQLYKKDGLEGGHVIMLGPGNDAAATAALAVGGGITDITAPAWLERGASKTDNFPKSEHSDCAMRWAERKSSWILVVGGGEVGMCPRGMSTETALAVDAATLQSLSRFASEYLVHAADVEGLCRGIDAELVAALAASPIPVTYAGGAKSVDDLALVDRLSGGKVDLTLGSVRYDDCVAWNKQQARRS